MTRTLRDAGVELIDGLEVSFFGRLETVASFGRLRLLAQGVDPRVAIGAAVLRRDQLLADLDRTGDRLAQQGLVAPATVRRVGLVSARTTAGRADVLSVLSRSPIPIEVIEAAAAMSGPAAPGELVQALARLQAASVDVVIIARGGGARSDLAAWDSSIVAQAIARCPVPVLTALGHATDRTVADLVAHASYETPSAAAGALVGRAEAALASDRAAADRQAQETQLVAAQRAAAAAATVAQADVARSRRRALLAAGIAVVAVLILVLTLVR